MKTRLLLILSLLVAVCMSLSVTAALTVVVDDDFDTEHTYFDGTDIDMGSNQWDGLYGTQWLASCSANIPTNSWLAYDLATNETTMLAPNDDFPQLFKNVVGPFVAEMKIGGTVSIEAWVTTLLMAADHAGNYSGLGAFGAIGQAYVARMQNGTRNIDLGLGTNYMNWYRMERSGNTITSYQKNSDTGNWYMVNALTNNALPPSVMVGPIVATHVANLNGIYFYDYFKISMDTSDFGAIQIVPSQINEPLLFGDSTSDSLVITNHGSGAVTWSLANKQPWYTLTPDSGVIPPHGAVQLQLDITAALSKGITTVDLDLQNDGIAAASVALTVTVTPEGGEIILVDDNFDDDHTYWDGTDVDVSGTPWDGVFGTQYLSSMDANETEEGLLTMPIDPLSDPTSIGGTDYAFPLLYKDVTGDFIAEMTVAKPISAEYIIYFLMCADLALSNDYLCGSFPFGPVWGFYDYNAAHTAGERTTDAGVGPFVTSNLYYRMVRIGDDFFASSRQSPDSNWFEFASYTPAIDYPDTMSVGLGFCESVFIGNTYNFDHVKISQVGAFPGQFMVLPTNITVEVTDTATTVQVSSPLKSTINIEVTSGASFLSAPSSVTLTDEVRNVELTLTSPTIDDVGTVTFTNAEGTPDPQVVTVTVVPEPATWCLLAAFAALMIRRR